MKKITKAQLAQGDGKEGRPALVAVEGKVFDVSKSMMWIQGGHMKQHHAGQDLTGVLPSAPHGKEVFERVEQVGELVEEPRAAAAAAPPAWALALLGLQPHPISVHFPQAFFTFAPLFLVLGYVFEEPSFERTSFYLLVAAWIMGLPAYATGLFNWYYKYGRRWNFYLRFKMTVAPILLLVGAVALAVHALRGPLPVDRVDLPVLVLQLLLVPIVVSLGHVGGKIAFGGKRA